MAKPIVSINVFSGTTLEEAAEKATRFFSATPPDQFKGFQIVKEDKEYKILTSSFNWKDAGD
ncbi:MAG: hypothetical protein HZA17_04195 [Nitrospirae bacterium]|nr:hypothetical protein [Nitrospirota bacterium]